MPPSGLLGIVVATALGGARLLPVIWMVAPLGGPRLPGTVRVGFALLLALVAAPALVAAGGAGALAELSVLHFTLLLAREIVVGLCLGLVASAAFRAAEVAGRLGVTRCAAPTSPRSWSPPPTSAPARSASSTCCWRRSCSCRSAASPAWSKR